MKKRDRKKRRTRTKNPTSDRIDLNRDRIYRISDPIQVAQVFYPAKNAHQRRAAFLAILVEIKNSKEQRLDSTNHIPGKYGLPASIISKVRAKMTRIGLIRKYQEAWILSSTFFSTLEALAEKVRMYMTPAQNREEREREEAFVEIAMTRGSK